MSPVWARCNWACAVVSRWRCMYVTLHYAYSERNHMKGINFAPLINSLHTLLPTKGSSAHSSLEFPSFIQDNTSLKLCICSTRLHGVDIRQFLHHIRHWLLFHRQLHDIRVDVLDRFFAVMHSGCELDEADSISSENGNKTRGQIDSHVCLFQNKAQVVFLLNSLLRNSNSKLFHKRGFLRSLDFLNLFLGIKFCEFGIFCEDLSTKLKSTRLSANSTKPRSNEWHEPVSIATANTQRATRAPRISHWSKCTSIMCVFVLQKISNPLQFWKENPFRFLPYCSVFWFFRFYDASFSFPTCLLPIGSRVSSVITVHTTQP